MGTANTVAPELAPSGKIGGRHQFGTGDAGLHEMVEPVDHGAIGAARRAGADMGFDQHGFVPRPSAPVPGAPLINGSVVDPPRSGPETSSG